MKRILFLTLLFITSALFTTSACFAQQNYTLEAKRGVMAGNYNFWVSTPYFFNETNEKMPLVVFLHGKSLCGNDLNKVKKYGTIAALERGLELDAVCLAPQNPGGPWNPEKLVKLLDYMEKYYRVDHNRIYVIGMSLGGYGTMDFVNAHPERIAAAMAMGGGCSDQQYAGLSQVPLWIVHGTADRLVPVSASQKVVNGIRSNFGGNLLIYSELPGIDHGKPARLFYQLDTYYWLMGHSLDYRRVDRSFTIDNQTLNRSYSDNMQHDFYEEEDEAYFE